MWLNNEKNLSISKSRYVNILMRYRHENVHDLEELETLKVALNHQDCEDFLISKAATIETLKIECDVEKNEINLEHLQLKVKSFKRVKKLIFCQIALTDEDVQVIGRNCPQLQSLHIIKCFCEHFQSLIPGANINLAEICKIKQLQELEITPDKPPLTERFLKLEYIHLILNELPQLKYLNLRNFTILCPGKGNSDETRLPCRIWSLEVLHMGHIKFDFWCTFMGLLTCCPRLRHLSVQASDVVINFHIINIFSGYCRNLEILELGNCEIDVQNFGNLQALQEITLSFCQGLTFNNLQQLLGGLKLKVFKLIHTRVIDTGNLIYISPTLESIVMNTVHFLEMSEIFQHSLNSFANLKTLQWSNGDINHNWIVEKCPQLQQLHISNSYHLWQIVIKIKSLRELKFTCVTSLSWSLIHSFIFKLSLRHLSIYSDCIIIGENTYNRNSPMMPTTLEILVIPLKMFLVGVNYWLDLLAVNKHLDFSVFGQAEDILNVQLLCLLLGTECVQQRCNRIKICGFQFELENFHKRTILREIAYAQINTNHYKEKKVQFTLEL